MTQEELRGKVDVTWKGYGNYRVRIDYRNRYYTGYAHDSQMWDTLNGAKCGYTFKQALQYFWNECKRQNNLK